MLYQGVHACLTNLLKSYICFSDCKALQIPILGLFLTERSYKVLFLLEKKFPELRNVVPTSEVQLPKSISYNQSFCYFEVSLIHFSLNIA